MLEAYTTAPPAETGGPGVLECFALFESITKPPVAIFTGGTSLDDLAEMANAAHKAAEQAARSAVVHARDCGTTLLAAKAKLKHGEFGAWVRENCQFSERQAQRYMLIAQRWERLVQSELGADTKTTRATDLSIEGLSIREALRILAGDAKQESPKVRDVFLQSRVCPSCGEHLAEIKPGICTCINCWDCKLYPTVGGSTGDNARFPYLDALSAWKRMSALDKQKFLEAVEGREDHGYLGEQHEQRRLSLPASPAPLSVVTEPETESAKYLRLEGALNSVLANWRDVADELLTIDEGPELLRQFTESMQKESAQ